MESTSDDTSPINLNYNSESCSKNVNLTVESPDEEQFYDESFELLYDNLCVKSFELPGNLKCTDILAESKKLRHDCVTCGAFTAFSDGYDSGGCFRLKEKLYASFLQNDTRKIVASDFSTVVAFLHDFTRSKRRLDDFWSIFKSKSWIEMSSTQIECFADDIEKFATNLKEKLIEKYEIRRHQYEKNDQNFKNKEKQVEEECLESQFSDLEAELACIKTKTKNFAHYILEFEFKIDVIDGATKMTSSSSTTTSDGNSKMSRNEYKSSLHQNDGNSEIVENEYKSSLHQNHENSKMAENKYNSGLHQSDGNSKIVENEYNSSLHLDDGNSRMAENGSNSSLHQSDGNSEIPGNEYKSSLHQSTFNILHRLEELLKLVANYFTSEFLKSLDDDESLINLYYDLINRRNCIISQGLTAVCCSILHQIYNDDWTNGKFEIWKTCGALISVHSFLSCYHEEKGMIEDLSEALTLIGQNCRFRLLKSFSQFDDLCRPLIDGKCPLTALEITIPLNRKLFRTITDHDPTFPESAIWFKIHPVLFTVGLNYEETLAKTMGGLNLERQLNQRAFEHYESYVRKFSAQISDENLVKNLRILIDNFRSILAQNCSKNVEIFQFSRRLNRLLGGQLILCCKSGKDRTAMAVTCDQTEFLIEKGFVQDRRRADKISDVLRNLGTRLENTLKNVGARRYAFTHLQLSFMPQNYRPPKGTFGKGQT